jgi:hypothetical protein
MKPEQIVKWLEAFAALAVWNPSLWDFHPRADVRRRQQLHYRCRGIVLHDRLLNGEKS